MFENTFWCNKCMTMASYKTCPHTDADRLLLSGTKAEQVKFVKGDNKLQALAEALRLVKYDVLLPDETPTKIVRRGTMSCPAGQKECTFTMIPPDTVSSVN